MCGNPMGDDDDALSEICALKDALYAQQELLQKLYSDLDAEREASASAASEALAVILRLQGEKAAVQMEADHYKRLSEEKICHAEESLAMIEDTVYQKEMEVAALDYQLQAYRSKLLSVGCDEHGFGGGTSRIGRRHSVPMSCKGERDLVCGDVEGKVVEEMCLDSGKKIDGYWEKIRRLDERVKEIAGGSSSRSETRSPSLSLSSRLSRGSLCDPTRDTGSSCQPNRMMDGIGETKSSDGVAADGSCSTSIHDVFEVPQANDERCESMEKDEIKNLEKEDVVFPEAVKMARDEPEWFKNVLQSSQVSDVDCGLVVAPPATSIAQFHMTMSQVGGRPEIVENDKPVTCSSREEELKLLHELKEKVNLLHDEIRSLKGKKPSPVRKEEKEEETSLAMALLAEAMLSFWL